MKKLVLLFISVVMATAIHAQRGKVVAAEAFLDNQELAAAEERINDALTHPKSENWAKTYIVAARLAAAQYAQDKSKDELVLKATENFFKAAELDETGDEKGKGKGRFQKDIKIALTFFLPELQNAGIEAYNNENYEYAMKAFESVINLNKLPLYASDNLPEDTIFIYYTGLAAARVKEYEKAEKYFLKAVELDYMGSNSYLALHEFYVDTKDTTKIEDNLKKGFELHPDDDRLLTSLINFYLQSSRNDEALVYLNTAIETDPENHSFYNARGVLNDINKDYDAALADYTKALELKPDYFEPILNMGVIYYNKGAEEMNAANDIRDNRKYEIARDAANGTFRKSLPYMEKAHELKADDLMVLETLRNLYYRFEMTDKYNEVQEKLNELRN